MDHDAHRIIKDEHLAISAVLHCLQHMTRSAIEGSAKLNHKAIRGMLYYIDAFPEYVHHPKEDRYLFAKLRQRTREAESVIRMLSEDHSRGPESMRGLMQAAIYLEWGGHTHLPEFLARLENYSDHYWRHIRIEETLILPLAERVLTEEDWREIDTAFGANKDPLAGVDAKHGFDELFARIVGLAAPPSCLVTQASAVLPSHSQDYMRKSEHFFQD
jgi:hemerythrin-like domain-containing protein